MQTNVPFKKIFSFSNQKNIYLHRNSENDQHASEYWGPSFMFKSPWQSYIRHGTDYKTYSKAYIPIYQVCCWG